MQCRYAPACVGAGREGRPSLGSRAPEPTSPNSPRSYSGHLFNPRRAPWRAQSSRELSAMTQASVKVGMIAEETGALSFMGRANANVARMVVDEINANGGLLGRKIELYLEDGATTDAVAEAKAAKLVAQDKVDVIFGGIYSSTRQAIKGPAVVKGRKLYIYPEQYEGQECDPLIFCTGPVPAQQVEPLIPWLMQQTGAKKFYL